MKALVVSDYEGMHDQGDNVVDMVTLMTEEQYSLRVNIIIKVIWATMFSTTTNLPQNSETHNHEEEI